MYTLPIKEEVCVFTSSEIELMQDALSSEDLNKNYLEPGERKKQKIILNNAVRGLLSSKKDILKVKYIQTDNENKLYFLVKYMECSDE